MQRFILEGNVSHYRDRLSVETDPAIRASIKKLLAEARRALALFESSQLGSKPQYPSDSVGAFCSNLCDDFLKEFNSSSHPYLIIDPGPGLKIVDANDAYCAATMIKRDDVAGRPLFEVFPDDPNQDLADGVSNLFESIKSVFQKRQPHEMPIQRYDIKDRDGVFVKRYWKPTNSPLLDHDGEIKLILHHVEDVTEQISRLENPSQ